jgi:nitroreductase
MNQEHTTGHMFSADLLIKEALMMDFSQLLEKRRSIRRFLDKDVSLELVMEIIQDACMAPSAVNGQPWEFIVIRNRALIKRLSD